MSSSTKFWVKSDQFVCKLPVMWKLLEARNSRNPVEHDQKLIRHGASHNEFPPPKFEPNLISVFFSANARKLLNQAEAMKQRKLEFNQKFIRPGEAHNELVH